MEYLIDNQYKLLLILIRVSVILNFAVFFSTKAFSRYMKIGLAVFITLLVAPNIKYSASDLNALDFVQAAAGEVLIGLEIGLVLMLITQIFAIFGGMLDMSAGLNMAQMFDLSSNMQVTILGQTFIMFSTLLFVLNDYHHKVIDLIFSCFDMIPLGFFHISSNMVSFLLQGVIYGFIISFPIMTVLLIIDLTLGITTRTIPQINIFSVGFIIKIFTGFFLVYSYMIMFNGVLTSAVNMVFKFTQNLQ